MEKNQIDKKKCPTRSFECPTPHRYPDQNILSH